MRWKISSLGDDARRCLIDAFSSQGIPGELCYFRARRRGRALGVCAAVGVTATIIGLVVSVSMLEGAAPLAARIIAVGLTGIAFVWTSLVLVEAVRASRSRTRPFVLVTPRVIVEADWEHACLTGYRLREATDFRAVDHYSGTNFRGRSYQFTFPEGRWSLVVREKSAIERLENVLAQARVPPAPGSDEAGLRLMPDLPGLPPHAGRRPFADPLGEAWLAVAALLIVGVLLGVIAGDVYSRYRGHS